MRSLGRYLQNQLTPGLRQHPCEETFSLPERDMLRVVCWRVARCWPEGEPGWIHLTNPAAVADAITDEIKAMMSLHINSVSLVVNIEETDLFC